MNTTPSNWSLAEIVAAAQRGESGAVDQIVLRTREMAARYAFGILGDRAAAEDVAQEALADAVSSLGELRAPEAFIVWLRRIVFRHCDRVLRRQRLRVVPLADMVDPVAEDPLPEDLVLQAERALAVRTAIHRLPEAQRDAACAFYLEERSQAAAAHVLGISVSTLNNRLHAARRALERNLIAMNPDKTAGISRDGMQMTVPDQQADAARVFDALEATSPAGQDWRNGRLSESRFDWSTSRIGIENEQLRALVGVYDLAMRIGRASVRTAGFNLDYTAPDAPEGTLAAVTTEAARAAGEAGYPLAVAVGHSEALRAAGFEPAWPHAMTFLRAGSLPDAPSAPPTESFEPVHRDDLAELDNLENEALTGTGVGPTYLVNKEPGGFSGRLWTDNAGKPAGYVSYAIVESWRNPALVGPSHQGYGRLLWHDRSAGDPTARLEVLAQLASEHGCDEVVFDRLHPHSPLARALRPMPVRVETGYRRYSIRVLSLEHVLNALIPDFDAKLDQARITTDVSLRLTIDDQTATLRGRPGQLTVDTDSKPVDGTIDGDQRLANLLVGTTSPEHVLADALTTGNGETLARVLFPYRAPQMDNQTL